MLKRLYVRRTLWDHTGSCSGCPVWEGGDADAWMGERIVGLDTAVSAWVGLETLDLFVDSPDTLFSTFSLLGSDVACEQVTEQNQIGAGATKSFLICIYCIYTLPGQNKIKKSHTNI